MKKSGLTDDTLVSAVKEIEDGLIDADLGKRVAVQGKAILRGELNEVHR